MKLIEPGQGPLSCNWPQLKRLMKLTFMLLFAGALSVSAKTFSQKVTIIGKNLHLDEVFEQIRQQTGLAFVMDRSLIDKIAPVTLHEKAAPVPAVLDKCLKGSNYTYRFLNNFIIITNALPASGKPPAPGGTAGPVSEAPAPLQDLHGLVTDSKGRPLEGASVQ